jgi:hypothetical protein
MTKSGDDFVTKIGYVVPEERFHSWHTKKQADLRETAATRRASALA